MRIKIEPKEFFMYAVFLAFSKEQPDLEDDAIKAYLDAHELIPKVQGTDQIDGQAFEILYFGGCYLGTHLQVIEDMQRQAVEQDLLRVEIEHVLQELTESRTRRMAEKMPEPELQALIANLIHEFHQDSSFSADEAGYLKVSLDPAVIQQRFVELVGNKCDESVGEDLMPSDKREQSLPRKVIFGRDHVYMLMHPCACPVPIRRVGA